MGSSLVGITKWVYINHILLYLVLFFPLLPILCCTTRSCHTDVSGGQNDTCHSEITLTVRALPAFLMLSGRYVDSSYRISFKAAREIIITSETSHCKVCSAHSGEVLGMLEILRIKRESPRTQRKLMFRTQKSR